MSFSSIVDWIGNQLSKILSWVLLLLPDSPFKDTDLSGIKSVVGYINYFVPVGVLLNITFAWVGAIVIYYAYSAILRLVKAIQ